VNRIIEIGEELKAVFSGRSGLFDSIIPPIVFLILNGMFGLQMAGWGSFLSVMIISIYRIIQRQSLWFALAGLGAALFSVGLTYWLHDQSAYFLPTIVSGVGTILLFLVSLIFKRPMAAYTSYLMRGWPLDWYWQPKVRPTYSEVTIIWAILFALRLGIQILLFQQGSTLVLAWLDFLLDWPFIILVLIGSYLYGLWRLQHLGGPSVEEWKSKIPPPWKSQLRGF
jgi:hypothetical protein